MQRSDVAVPVEGGRVEPFACRQLGDGARPTPSPRNAPDVGVRAALRARSLRCDAKYLCVETVAGDLQFLAVVTPRVGRLGVVHVAQVYVAKAHVKPDPTGGLQPVDR